ncbi:MAG TPA: redoxin domain-containing protein [Candidatus Methylomirabilis sp.]|nr:redoxin domain-containing protein [Candidatus Methylomirabilis sp.]
MGRHWDSVRFPPVFLGTVVLLCACLTAGAAVRAQEAVLGLDGKATDPLKLTPDKVVVLVFVRADCPVANRYAPTLQKLGATFAVKAAFWLVYPSKGETAETIEKHEREYGYKFPALRDPQHVLVKESHAEITPEVAVFDRNRRLVYHGRIDNLYVEIGRARRNATTHELADAIEAAYAGKTLAVSETRSVGCYISDLE